MNTIPNCLCGVCSSENAAHVRDIEDRERNEANLQHKLDEAREELNQKNTESHKMEQQMLEFEKALKHKKEKLRQERVIVGELREQLDTARHEYAALEAERAGLLDDMSSQRSTVELSSANVTELKSKLEHLDRRIQELEPKLRETETELEDAREENAE